MGLAPVVGLYGGIAAGLFATAIRFVQLVVFRGAEVLVSLRQRRVAGCACSRPGSAPRTGTSSSLRGRLLLIRSRARRVGAKRCPCSRCTGIRAVALAAGPGLACTTRCS